MTTKFPLLVQFEFHPASKEAAPAAEYLHEVLSAEAVRAWSVDAHRDSFGSFPKPAVIAPEVRAHCRRSLRGGRYGRCQRYQADTDIRMDLDEGTRS